MHKDLLLCPQWVHLCSRQWLPGIRYFRSCQIRFLHLDPGINILVILVQRLCTISLLGSFHEHLKQREHLQWTKIVPSGRLRPICIAIKVKRYAEII